MQRAIRNLHVVTVSGGIFQHSGDGSRGASHPGSKFTTGSALLMQLNPKAVRLGALPASSAYWRGKPRCSCDFGLNSGDLTTYLQEFRASRGTAAKMPKSRASRGTPM